MKVKHIIMKLALVASISSLGACSNEDTSTYVFPQDEFTAIHQEILRAHWGLYRIWHFGSHVSYTIPEMKKLDSWELIESTGRLFKEIIEEVINPMEPDEVEKIIFNSDGSIWQPFGETDLSRIEAVPGMTELLDICIHQVQDLTGACLWDNWSILSDAWEALGRSHP